MASIIRATTTSGLQVAPDNSGSLQLQTNGTTTALTIDTSQNVGIGTSSPASSLDVQAVDARSIIRLTATTGTNPVYSRASNTGGFLYLGRDGSSGTDFGAGAYAAGVWSTGAYPMVFGTNGTERMRIDSGGGVYVGKTTAAETTAGWYFTPGSGNLGLSAGNYFVLNYVPGGASTMIDFRTGGVGKGSISQNGTNTAYNTSSDYRLKENIIPLSNALDAVNKLKPRQFDWKENSKTTTGFIAHELAEVMPDCVTGEKDAVDENGNIKPQGIDTSFLVATLTAAIQEQQTIINDLKARVETLEGAK